MIEKRGRFKHAFDHQAFLNLGNNSCFIGEKIVVCNYTINNDMDNGRGSVIVIEETRFTRNSTCLLTKDVPLASITTGKAPLGKSPAWRGLSFPLRSFYFRYYPIMGVSLKLNGKHLWKIRNHINEISFRAVAACTTALKLVVDVCWFPLNALLLEHTLLGSLDQGECKHLDLQKINGYPRRYLLLNKSYRLLIKW